MRRLKSAGEWLAEQTAQALIREIVRAAIQLIFKILGDKG